MAILSPSSTVSRIGFASHYAALRVLDTASERRADVGYGIQGQETSGGLPTPNLQSLTHTTPTPGGGFYSVWKGGGIAESLVYSLDESTPILRR